jgi:hypothetical protein
MAGTIQRHSADEPEVMYCHVFNEKKKGYFGPTNLDGEQQRTVFMS